MVERRISAPEVVGSCPVTQCARRTVKLEFSVFEPEFSMLITQMVYYGFEVICRELTIIAAVSIHG